MYIHAYQVYAEDLRYQKIVVSQYSSIGKKIWVLCKSRRYLFILSQTVQIRQEFQRALSHSAQPVPQLSSYTLSVAWPQVRTKLAASIA